MEISGQLYTQAVLPPGKSPQYPMNTRQGGPQEPIRMFWRRELPHYPALSLVTIPTELPWHYHRYGFFHLT